MKAYLLPSSSNSNLSESFVVVSPDAVVLNLLPSASLVGFFKEERKKDEHETGYKLKLEPERPVMRAPPLLSVKVTYVRQNISQGLNLVKRLFQQKKH